MLIEVLGLGMPVAAAFGWWVGRRPPVQKSKVPSSRYRLHPTFLSSLNSNRSCSIVEEIYRLNPDSVDLRFALAALYREQGDYSRAVEMHQSILENDRLHASLYARVTMELARDYLSAGFLDRAEEMLDQLVAKHLLMRESLQLLLGIYEQTKEWSKAIIVAKRLRYQGEKCDYLIAQYHCELAQQSLLEGRVYEALTHYQHACLVEPGCVRANIGMAQFHQQRQEYAKAICHYRAVFDSHADYLALVVEPMYACFQAIERADEFVRELRNNNYYRSFVSVMHVVAKHIDSVNGRRQALAFVQTELQYLPALSLLLQAVQWAPAKSPAQQTQLQLWQQVLERHLKKRKSFSCRHCGHRYDSMSWRCHACDEWAQVVPLVDQSRIHRCAETMTEFSI
jgi:lipopolysaccharide biosynthesis regulator YciM